MTNVGIAGIGFMGMIHYNAYQRIEGAEVTAMCEKIQKRLDGDWTDIKGNFGPQGTMMDLAGIAKYTELDQMLADPNVEMVDVCLPPALHAPVAIQALEAGKHVFCEKPIALKAEDAVAMVDAAHKAGKTLSIGHVLPFFPQYDFAYKAVTSGRYGRIIGGHFKRIISDPTVTWLPDFFNPETIGGPMIDLHVHDAHFIRLLCGMPKAVQTVGRMRGDVVELFGSQFYFDDPSLVVTAASGVINQQGRPFTHAFEIYLEKATLLFDLAGIPGAEGMPLRVLTEDGNVEAPELPGGDEIGFFANEIREVLSAVESNTPSAMLDGQLARDAIILCHKQTQSAREGKLVEV